jgi:hypothetical protein
VIFLLQLLLLLPMTILILTTTNTITAIIHITFILAFAALSGGYLAHSITAAVLT